MTAYYNDIDPYCCRVLRKQIALGNLPQGDVDDRDIRDVHAHELARYDQVHLFAGIGGIPLGLRWAGMPDDFNIITGGFPCQDISNAGKRAGINGSRSGLWSEYARIIRELRPRYVLVENVAALLVRGLDRVLGDLAACGYDAEWSVLSACSMGASHTRERVFVVAYTNSQRRDGRPDNTTGRNVQRWHEVARQSTSSGRQGATQSSVCRVAYGVSSRMERLRGLGNAVYPVAAEYIGQRIMAVENAL